MFHIWLFNVQIPIFNQFLFILSYGLWSLRPSLRLFLFLQHVLTASSGGGARWMSWRCASGAAGTFTPPLLSTAAAPVRDVCVGRGFTATRGAFVSSPPSVLAMTRASSGRYTHTHTHKYTQWLAYKINIHLLPIWLQPVPIVPASLCSACEPYQELDVPSQSLSMCYLLIKRCLLEDEWHALQATLQPHLHQLCRTSCRKPQLGKPAWNYLWKEGIL